MKYEKLEQAITKAKETAILYASYGISVEEENKSIERLMEIKNIIEKVKTPNDMINSQIDTAIFYSTFSDKEFEEVRDRIKSMIEILNMDSDDGEHEDDFDKRYQDMAEQIVSTMFGT